MTHVTLCLVTNEAFAIGAEATLRSAVAATSVPVTAYLVDVDLRPATRERLAGLGARVVWVDLDEGQRDLLASFYTDDRFSHWAAYARVLLGQFLPNLDRIIYLDTDTVVLADLTELCAFDLAGHTVAAVNDAWIAGLHTRSVLGRDPSRALQIPRYFNSGVMLIDHSRWRAAHVTERMVALLSQRKPFVYYDQDPLNIVLAQDWTELPERWNRLIPQPDAVAAPSSAEARKGGTVRDRLLERAAIVHFIGSRKPWTVKSILEPQFAELFWSHVSRPTKQAVSSSESTESSSKSTEPID